MLDVAVARLLLLDCHRLIAVACLIAVTCLIAVACHRLALPLLGITIAWHRCGMIYVALYCSCFVLLLLGGVGGAFAMPSPSLLLWQVCQALKDFLEMIVSYLPCMVPGTPYSRAYQYQVSYLVQYRYQVPGICFDTQRSCILSYVNFYNAGQFILQKCK